MSEKLPVGEFEFFSLTLDDIKGYDKESNYGYFVEVDAHIPNELHEYLNDLPPLPEKLQIFPEMTSGLTREGRCRRFGDKVEEQKASV